MVIYGNKTNISANRMIHALIKKKQIMHIVFKVYHNN